jgi:Heterokaryon incompatibility protein (HET)
MYVADLTPFEGLGIHAEGRHQIYEALSYSWGHPERTASIITDQEVLYVPTPMADALQHLRYTDRDRWLWCDPLCVDQSNLTEQSTQVQIMMLIFSKATWVVAWLRNPPETLLSMLQNVPDASQLTDEQKLWLASRPIFAGTWVR